MQARIQRAGFLINHRSGGGQGRRLHQQITALLPDTLCLDLCAGGLLPFVRQLQVEQRMLVICGGDGSIASVLDCLYENNIDLAPGLIPLGTGNDLAKTLGWRGLAAAPLAVLLEALNTGTLQQLDRMQVRGPQLLRSWYNYCSWGLDAEIAYHFDKMRKQTPRLFFHPLINKVVYGLLGLRQRGECLQSIIDINVPMGASIASIASIAPVALAASGETHAPLRLSLACRSMLCANINSYAGGMHLHSAVRLDDGCFDLFQVPVGLNALLAILRWRRLRPYGQVAQAQLRLRRPTMMQCDGEAWLAGAGTYQIERAGQVSILSARGCSAC